MNLQYNTKFYSLILLLAFLTAQISLVLHTAEHGVLEHTHSGEQCEHYVFSKHFNADTPNAAVVKVAFVEYKASYASSLQIPISKEQSRHNLARAPPYYS